MNEENHSERPSAPPPLPAPQSFRRGLVFGVGVGLLLVSIIIANTLWEYFDSESSSISTVAILVFIFSIWGLSYIIYLWISFLLIAVRKLPGCEFTAISHELLKKDIHLCVDSILNSRLDNMQQQIGMSTKLLGTESAQKWIIGLMLLYVLVYFLTLDMVNASIKLIIVGVFSSIYLLYDITIHKFSVNRKDLSGRGDYPRLTLQFLIALAKSTISKSHD